MEQRILMQLLALAIAVVCHEVAHGWVALRFGDPTAKAIGRLTLNPVRHLDPLGTIAFFLINIGWARPVPVNGAYFKNPRKDMIWVALAGPLTNLFLAVVSAIAAKIIYQLSLILPGTLVTEAVLVPLFAMVQASVWINLVLCIFNFLPIPPLDGSRVLMGVLPESMTRTYASFERYGFLIILILAFSGILSKMIYPIINFAGSLLSP